ncbi:dihydrofolate reductase family protein [Flavitalea antarctica]
MRKIILYIAMSLDGYIAGKDDNIDFLSSVDVPGEDYGYLSFQKDIDTLIWGRRTYDKLLSFGIEFPHKDKKCYVFSRSRTGSDENVTYFGDLDGLIKELHKQEGKNIYCDGGGELVFELLQRSLIDTLIVSVIPYLVGDGIRLFRDGRPSQALEFKKCVTYPSGLVQLWYNRPSKPVS